MCQYPFYNIDYSGNYRPFRSEKIQWIKIKKYLHGITLKIIYPQLKTPPLAGVSTVASSHHFDYKNELRRSEGAASLSIYGTFRWTLSKNNFFGIPRKLQAPTRSRINQMKQYRYMKVMQQLALFLQMRYQLIHGSYLVFKWLNPCLPTMVLALSKNWVFDLWTAVSDRNINSSIEV